MIAAVIVAAGKGARMQAPLRKQYLSLAGLPILARTLLVFDGCDLIEDIYLVIPKADLDFCREKIVSRVALNRKLHLVFGGARRQDSVYNGLQKIDPDCSIVVIHDGVRPFVSIEQVVATINGARAFGACILGVPAHDTLKQVDAAENIVHTLQRDNIWLAQTPQTFRCDLIKKAHEKAKADGYLGTDDASLVERLGEPVKIIPGSRGNIKITQREDLKMAQCLLASENFEPDSTR
ncbi:MAG: 2-C-methyl-D-erythritol 4-phosphate cytidylyltransferase [Desulfobacterales bacterium]|jgi:2-C-methyl-D-erythritol 4-phosphate cytidylyltransferase